MNQTIILSIFIAYANAFGHLQLLRGWPSGGKIVVRPGVPVLPGPITLATVTTTITTITTTPTTTKTTTTTITTTATTTNMTTISTLTTPTTTTTKTTTTSDHTGHNQMSALSFYPVCGVFVLYLCLKYLIKLLAKDKKINKLICLLVYEKIISGDIIQGLPKIEQILESRISKLATKLIYEPGLLIKIKSISSPKIIILTKKKINIDFIKIFLLHLNFSNSIELKHLISEDHTEYI